MKQLFTLLLPFCFLLIACDDDGDDIVENPDYTALEQSAFDCTNADSWQLDFVDFPINEAIKFGDYFVLGGFEDLLVMDENLEMTILEQEVGVRKLLPYENQLIICGKDGLYQFTPDAEFTILDDEVKCNDVIIGPNGELLVADAWTLTQVVKEFVAGEIVEYSDISPERETCIGIEDLALSNDGTVWASTCRDLILKFNGRTFEEAFNTEEEPLLERRSSDLFLVPYQDGAIVVAKSGVGFYQILKYAGGEWIELIHFSLLESVKSSKEVFMTRPSLVDAFIKDDFLYVATTMAGCEGIQRFDITKNEKLTEEDYDAFEDPFYASQCIHGFTLEEDGDVYVVASYNNLVLVDCP